MCQVWILLFQSFYWLGFIVWACILIGCVLELVFYCGCVVLYMWAQHVSNSTTAIFNLIKLHVAINNTFFKSVFLLMWLKDREYYNMSAQNKTCIIHAAIILMT